MAVSAQTITTWNKPSGHSGGGGGGNKTQNPPKAGGGNFSGKEQGKYYK